MRVNGQVLPGLPGHEERGVGGSRLCDDEGRSEKAPCLSGEHTKNCTPVTFSNNWESNYYLRRIGSVVLCLVRRNFCGFWKILQTMQHMGYLRPYFHSLTCNQESGILKVVKVVDGRGRVYETYAPDAHENGVKLNHTF